MRGRSGFWLGLALPLAAGAQYAGREACKECHPGQFAAQFKTGHAHALARTRPGEPGEWAFGAGAKAITYVSHADRDHYLEHGLSYYPALKSRALTPGHTDANGRLYRTFDPEGTTLRCFRCHSTGPLSVDPDGGIRPAEPGVQCESCHGAGAEHVRSGGAGGTIRNPKALSAAELTEFCGTCHRNAPERDWTDPWKVRHQPSYLVQSACFRASGGRLACTTCHDPHGALSRTAADYDRRCVSCHGSAAHHTVSTASKSCIGCHMPQVATNAPVGFTNHWIGIYAPDYLLVPARGRGKGVPPVPLPVWALHAPADPAGLRPRYEEALVRQEKKLPRDDAAIARSASDLGLFLSRNGDPAAAEAPLRRAIAIDEAIGGPRLAADRESLAQVLAVNGKAAEAYELFQRAAAASDPEIAARCYAALAALNPGHAESNYRAAVAAQEKAAQKDPRTLATLLNNLALAVEQRKGFDEAERLLRRALAMQQTGLGADHPATASTLSNLGSLLQSTGRLAEAERLERTAVHIFERKLGPYSAELATSSTNLADLLWSKGDRSGAAALYRRAVTIDESVYGRDHPEVAGDLLNLGQVLKESGARTDAEAALRRALGIYAKAFGESSPQAEQTRKILAQ